MRKAYMYLSLSLMTKLPASCLNLIYFAKGGFSR